MKKLIVGTRGSKLALCQARIVIDQLQKEFPSCKFDVKIIKTLGDKITNINLSKINDKGFFVKEIQEQLLEKKIDVAVHSLKDMPVYLDKTNISTILKREDHRDVLVSNKKIELLKLQSSDTIGTTSIRRKIQIRSLNKNVKIIDVRGNVDTRVNKMIKGECSALVLAAAGVKRLGLEKYIVQYLDNDNFTTAPGQGAIALEILTENEIINKHLKKINDKNSNICTQAERIFMGKIGGGCHMPFGCFAQIENNMITITGMIASINNFLAVRKKITGNINEYKNLSKQLAKDITKDEGQIIMNELKNNSHA